MEEGKETVSLQPSFNSMCFSFFVLPEEFHLLTQIFILLDFLRFT
jgi:hypothetical protein